VLDCAEANLDTEYLMAISQNVPTTYWYKEEVYESSTFVNWLVEVADTLNPPKVISISYGMGEHYMAVHEVFVFDVEARKLALQGVTLIAAAGDSGVAGDEEPSLCGYNPGKLTGHHMLM
jgi:subtilase family serine protease